MASLMTVDLNGIPLSIRQNGATLRVRLGDTDLISAALDGPTPVTRTGAAIARGFACGIIAIVTTVQGDRGLLFVFRMSSGDGTTEEFRLEHPADEQATLDILDGRIEIAHPLVGIWMLHSSGLVVIRP